MIRRIPNKTSRGNSKTVIIPIHPSLAALLREQPRSDVYVLPESAALYSRDSSRLTLRIQAHFKHCGVTTSDGDYASGRSRVTVGFHSLRHTFVSLCRGAGMSLAVVEALVGHSSSAMTRYYTHVDTESASLSALPSLDEPATPAPALPERGPLSIIREIAVGMTEANWREMMEKILAECEKTGAA